jgi:hypothetical protein
MNTKAWRLLRLAGHQALLCLLFSARVYSLSIKRGREKSDADERTHRTAGGE